MGEASLGIQNLEAWLCWAYPLTLGLLFALRCSSGLALHGESRDCSKVEGTVVAFTSTSLTSPVEKSSLFLRWMSWQVA